MGTGMPESARLSMWPWSTRPPTALCQATVTSSASGHLQKWPTKVSLSGMREVRAIDRRPGQSTT